MITDRYYFNKLNEEERQIYKAIYTGINEYKDYVEVPGISLNNKVVGLVYYFVVCDNPYFFSVGEYAMQHAVDGDKIKITTLFNRKEEEKARRQVEKEVNKIISNPELKKMTDYEKEKYVHDYLIENVEYDHSAGNGGTILSPYTVYGVFVEKKAVCEGIAKATKLLLNALNVNCIIVSGDVKGEDGGHAWNIVKIGQDAVHLDVTFDMGKTIHKGFPHYDYFNLSSAVIERKPINEHLLPQCNSMKHHPVVVTGGYVSTKTQLISCFENAFRAELPVLTIKLSKQDGSEFKNIKNTEKVIREVYSVATSNTKISTEIFIDTTGFKDTITIEITYKD